MKDFLQVNQKSYLRSQTPVRAKPRRKRATLLAVVIFFLVTVVPVELNPIANASGPDSSHQTHFAAYHHVPQPLSLVNPARKLHSRFGRVYPDEKVDNSPLSFSDKGEVLLPGVPTFSSVIGDRFVHSSDRNEYVFYTLDPELQKFATKIVKDVKAPHVALVAIEPTTGKILALAAKSNHLQEPLLHADFPAASLFKVITTAAVLENTNVTPNTVFHFRGGTYTLQKWNYQPSRSRDKRAMGLQEALGRSCNPVFARVALGHLNPPLLRDYAQFFGFNAPLPFDVPIDMSKAVIPNSDYEFSRTAAGFGQVRLSPIHAVSLMAALANNGLMPRPRLVEEVVTSDGHVLHQAQAEYLRRIVEPNTANELLDMMEATTTVGTSKREFFRGGSPLLPGVSVSGKTGTLRGKNPNGINNWFIGAAPKNNPKVAVAALVVYPRHVTTRASRIARLLIQKYLKMM